MQPRTWGKTFFLNNHLVWPYASKQNGAVFLKEMNVSLVPRDGTLIFLLINNAMSGKATCYRKHIGLDFIKHRFQVWLQLLLTGCVILEKSLNLSELHFAYFHYRTFIKDFYYNLHYSKKKGKGCFKKS